jgi:TRAP transporter TAXI family solute receptor
MNNPRMVAGGQADLGALGADHARWAYEGQYELAKEGPRHNLRVIAAVHFPAWLGIAVRCETNITDLSQIRERQLPVRVVGGGGPQYELVFEHYGLSRKLIESWGGRFQRVGYLPLAGFVTSGDFDVIMEPVYAAYTPEARHWWEASVLHNLRFLPMPDDLIQRICKETGGEPSAIPHQLMRGVVGDIPSVARPQHLIYSRDDLPDDFAYLLAKTLDEKRHLFREVFVPYSYDPNTVARDNGIPLHPGAERYYREAGYLR